MMINPKYIRIYIILVLSLILTILLLGAVSCKNFRLVQQVLKVLSFIGYTIAMLQTVLYKSHIRQIVWFRYSLMSFIIMLAFYSLFSNHFKMIFPVMSSLLAFYFFYYYTLKGYLGESIYMYFIIVYFFVCAFLFYDIMAYRFTYLTKFDEGGGINTGYNILGFLVLALVYHKKTFVFLLSTLAFIMILFCMKRGAVVCGTVIYLFMFVKYLKNSPIKSVWKLYIIWGFITLVIMCVLINNQGLFHRFDMQELRSGSGRNSIYFTILNNYWKQESIWGVLFGNGFFAVTDMYFPGYGIHKEGFYAHSDFYEVIWDHGAFGLFLYASILFSLFSFFMHSINYKYLMWAFIISFLIRAYVSGVYTLIDGQVEFALIGYLMGQNEKGE